MFWEGEAAVTNIRAPSPTEQAPLLRCGGHLPWRTTAKPGQQAYWPFPLSNMVLLILHLELPSSFQTRRVFLVSPIFPASSLTTSPSFLTSMPEDGLRQPILDFYEGHVYYLKACELAQGLRWQKSLLRS